MEDMEMTPMTTGTAVSVSQPQFEREADVSPQEEAITSKEVFEDPNLGVEEPTDEAEMLFKSAKDEGFEEALTHLAEGDFETGVIEEEPEEGLSDENTEGDDRKKIVESKSEDEIETEKEELLAKIDVLEEKVSHILERNEELQERLIKAEERADMSQEMLLEMFKYLYEMAKKEEDEKKKLSFLEALLAIVARFLITIADPDAKVDDGKKEETAAPRSKKTPTFEEMIKFLNKRAAEGSTAIQQPQSETPEPMAAAA